MTWAGDYECVCVCVWEGLFEECFDLDCSVMKQKHWPLYIPVAVYCWKCSIKWHKSGPMDLSWATTCGRICFKKNFKRYKHSFYYLKNGLCFGECMKSDPVIVPCGTLLHISYQHSLDITWKIKIAILICSFVEIGPETESCGTERTSPTYALIENIHLQRVVGFLLRSICHLKPLCHRALLWRFGGRAYRVIYVSKSLRSGGRWSDAVAITHTILYLKPRKPYISSPNVTRMYVLGDDSADVFFSMHECKSDQIFKREICHQHATNKWPEAVRPTIHK